MRIYCCPRKHPIGFKPISEGPARGPSVFTIRQWALIASPISKHVNWIVSSNYKDQQKDDNLTNLYKQTNMRRKDRLLQYS
uniref:Uncharacterized protein n=1 Tax=Arundo donax TaxID=35708 RepID=A0A0A9GCP9_ARUDO